MEYLKKLPPFKYTEILRNECIRMNTYKYPRVNGSTIWGSSKKFCSLP